jgi:RNA polymerase sigma factor (sigma-70 family)
MEEAHVSSGMQVTQGIGAMVSLPQELVTDPPSALVVPEAGTFDAVYQRNFDALFRLASMLVSSTTEGEEIAQEAFVRWYARRTVVKDPDSYLRTVVINLTRDGLRRRYTAKRRAHLFQTEAREAAVGAEATPSTPMLDMIAHLPARQRAVVLLRFYEGRSEHDIASIIGCRPGTVKSLLSRALDALRKEVGR